MPVKQPKAKPEAPVQPTEADIVAPALQQQLEDTLDAGRKIEAAVHTIAAQQFECAKVIGQLQMANMFETLAGTSRVAMLRQMKESKAYKGMVVPQANGTTISIANFEQFCEFMGLSSSKVYEDIKNLNMFGEAFMESAQLLGLGYKQLRQLRALPEDDRSIIIEGERVSNDPEALKELLEDVIIKNSKEKTELHEKLEETQATLQAKDKVLGTKNKQLDTAHTELAKLKNLTPDEWVQVQGEKETAALRDLHAAGLDMQGAWVKYLALATATLQLQDVSSSTVSRVTEFTSGLCSTIANDLNIHSIDIDFRTIVYPPWLGDIPQRGDSTSENQ